MSILYDTVAVKAAGINGILEVASLLYESHIFGGGQSLMSDQLSGIDDMVSIGAGLVGGVGGKILSEVVSTVASGLCSVADINKCRNTSAVVGSGVVELIDTQSFVDSSIIKGSSNTLSSEVFTIDDSSTAVSSSKSAAIDIGVWLDANGSYVAGLCADNNRIRTNEKPTSLIAVISAVNESRIVVDSSISRGGANSLIDEVFSGVD